MSLIYRLVEEQIASNANPQTVFTLTYTPIGSVSVYLNDFKLIKGTTTTNGDYYFNTLTSLTLTNGGAYLSSNDIIKIIYLTAEEVVETDDISVLSNLGDSCGSNIIKDGLIGYWDISNIKSWNGNLDLDVINLASWDYYKIKEIELNDYGLTQYDIGFATSLTGTSTIEISDYKLPLKRIGENNASGNTSYSAYTISAITSTGLTGSYFELSGGWLSNFFKLDGYDYELLPPRYENGYSFELSLRLSESTFTNITNPNDGFFLYMGARAENKFSTAYSGDSGYTTYSGGSLDTGDHSGDTELNVYDNIIGFRVNENKNIGFRYLDENGLLVEKYSIKTLPYNGWFIVGFVFKPYEKLSNEPLYNREDLESLLHCKASRKGDLIVYVNGSNFHTFKDFDEIIFSEMETTPDKQIGVPYTISWGGGTFGLRHSWHYSTTTDVYEQDNTKQGLLLETLFGGTFYGGIQKLRIYNKPLSPSDMKNNFNAEATLYGLNKNQGGRLIYK